MTCPKTVEQKHYQNFHDQNNYLARIVAAADLLGLKTTRKDDEYLEIIITAVKDMDNANKVFLSKKR